MITYTTVTNGALIDLGVYSLPPGNPAQPNYWPLVTAVLPSSFLGGDFKVREATLYNEGKRKQIMTTLGGVAHALVSILDKPEQTKNKRIQWWCLTEISVLCERPRDPGHHRRRAGHI